MLEDNVLHTIGSKLRLMYGEIPKGPIPDRLWDLLLLMEQRDDDRAAGLAHGTASSDGRTPMSPTAGGRGRGTASD